MSVGQYISAALVLSIALAWNRGANAEDMVLSARAEPGFRCFMQAAQDGQLGAAVVGANVSVEKDHARIELIDKAAGSIPGVVEAKRSAQSPSRYFEVRFVDATTAARVANVLDSCFPADPFEPVAAPPIPLEEPITARSTVPYTVAVIICVSLLSVWALVVLWCSTPPRAQ